MVCETDYFRRRDLLCHTCGGPLKGSYVSALEKKFHVEHFGCSEPTCGVTFGPQDSYYEDGGAVYCKYHYCTARAQFCGGCDCPIIGQYVEIFRNQITQWWHPECYMIHKFWNVKMQGLASARVQRKDRTWFDGFGVPLEREQLIQAFDDLEGITHRIWAVVSAFEEAVASDISNLLVSVQQGREADLIDASRSLLRYVSLLFEVLQHIGPGKSAHCFPNTR